ncbi:hypothetical protein OH76DRAFT_1102756 [Lentinus brumalis]|uniref:Uncharacterized protein n=1 Tax=Lentinus brumalis TaxID=2498619 RepID=A0A371CVM2_9APHY|nr:hypothetical protein OH76DRAFT_1102756 [Polyporus brumalis]
MTLCAWSTADPQTCPALRTGGEPIGDSDCRVLTRVLTNERASQEPTFFVFERQQARTEHVHNLLPGQSSIRAAAGSRAED